MNQTKDADNVQLKLTLLDNLEIKKPFKVDKQIVNNNTGNGTFNLSFVNISFPIYLMNSNFIKFYVPKDVLQTLPNTRQKQFT